LLSTELNFFSFQDLLILHEMHLLRKKRQEEQDKKKKSFDLKVQEIEQKDKKGH